MRNPWIGVMVVITALIWTGGAPAHAAEPLLGNLGSTVDGDFGGAPDAADDFVTGNVGLNISSIDVLWQLGNGGLNRVGIFADLAGVPDTTQIGTWFTSATATTPTTLINYFGSASLAANTVYWLAVDIADDSQPSFTLNQVVFSAPSTFGATIPGSSGAFGSIQTGSWTNDSSNSNIMYQLNTGTALPEPRTLRVIVKSGV